MFLPLSGSSVILFPAHSRTLDRAFSSGGERFPDTEEVRSSNLLTPTKCSQLRGFVSELFCFMPAKHATKPADPLPYTVPIGPKAASAPPAITQAEPEAVSASPVITHADPKVASTAPAIIPTKPKIAQTTLAVAPTRPGCASRPNPDNHRKSKVNGFPEK